MDSDMTDDREDSHEGTRGTFSVAAWRFRSAGSRAGLGRVFHALWYLLGDARLFMVGGLPSM